MQEAEADLQGQPPGATRGLSKAATEASDRLTSAEMCRGSVRHLYTTPLRRIATRPPAWAWHQPDRLNLSSYLSPRASTRTEFQRHKTVVLLSGKTVLRTTQSRITQQVEGGCRMKTRLSAKKLLTRPTDHTTQHIKSSSQV